MSEIRRLRVNQRMTVEQLADKAGVSARQIRNLEDGTVNNPQVATLGKLADALSTLKHTVEPSDIDPFVASESSAA